MREMPAEEAICSVDYKKVLRNVSEKRTKIQERQSEIKLMKQDLENRRSSFGFAFGDDHDDSTTAKTKMMTGSSISTRRVILTPGGNKRKVKPGHVKFKAELKGALEHLVCKKTEAIIMVDDLVAKLQDRFPGVKGFERGNILSTILKLYGKKVEYMGKKKKAYYRGLSFIEETDLEISELLSSNTAMKQRHYSKARRGLILDSGDKDETVDLESSVEETAMACVEGHGVAATKTFMNMQDLLLETQQLEDAVPNPEENIQKLSKEVTDLKESFFDYDSCVQETIAKQDEVISLQEDIFHSGRLLGGLLSLSERNSIKEEVEKAKEIFNLNLRVHSASDICHVFDPLLFQKLVTNVKITCPTITNVLEQLVLSSNTSRNTVKTENLKMKAAVHILASLLDVRDQHSKNDIPLLFGLLCICYGAGPAMIRVLQRLGLSESFPVLIGVLKNQLTNYKEIIHERLCANLPVVTYQDNMQISRTSLRHLRLSKLQKEKMRQEKMWDFTVRGWREADITGIEPYFEDKDLAVKPAQQTVKSMKYEDTKIENNAEQHKKWLTFKDRNLLRKLDLALNNVVESEEEIRSAKNEDLQKFADAAQAREKQPMGKKLYKIVVPGPEEDYPDLGRKKPNIFPLPISHENQCKTVGLASNLDLFADEFGFHCENTPKYTPLRSSGKEYALEKAYERFAFMKSLEKHKKEQIKYEQILRGTAEQSLEDPIFTTSEMLVVVDDNASTDSEGED